MSERLDDEIGIEGADGGVDGGSAASGADDLPGVETRGGARAQEAARGCEGEGEGCNAQAAKEDCKTGNLEWSGLPSWGSTREDYRLWVGQGQKFTGIFSFFLRFL